MKNKVKNRFKHIFKIAFILFALLVFIIQTASFLFPYDDIIEFLKIYLNYDIAPLSFNITNQPSQLEIFYLRIQDIFYVVAVASAFIGAIIFSRGRSFLDGLGIFLAFIIPRKRKLSGSVYDVGKSQPIAFTSIRVVRRENDEEKIVASAITDLDGKYKIYLEKIERGLYIQAKASGYQVYEQELTGIYKKTVIQDIPLKNEKNIESWLKTYYYTFRPKLYAFLIYYLFVLSILSLIFAIWGPLIFDLNPTSLGYIILYSCAVIWNSVTIYDRVRFKPGKILEYKTNVPVPSAIISILDKEKQLQVILSDINGVARANLVPGIYKVKVTRSGLEMVDRSGHEIENVELMIGKDGYLPEDIYMKKTNKDSINIESSMLDLVNPFGE